MIALKFIMADSTSSRSFDICEYYARIRATIIHIWIL